jgi:hypothetical protein
MAIKVLIFGALTSLSAQSAFGQDGPAADTKALRQEATRYENGHGVKVDYAEAYRLYCKAALLGDKYAASSLAWMYLNHRGVETNMHRATGWLKTAAGQGDYFAAKMLQKYMEIEPEGDPDCHEEAPPSPAPPHVVTRRVASNDPDRKLVENWVKQIAPKYSIDPDLVLAVIEAESGFNAGALSGKNAQGLMQLIPQTAERFGIRDVWNPIENIKGGTAYLHWLLRHFGGNVEWTLAAYNAGENNVERYKGVPPFDETQHYVQSILAGYQKTQHPVPPELTKKNQIDQEILRLASVLQPLH